MTADIVDLQNYTFSYYAIPTFIVAAFSFILVVYQVIREEFSFLGLSFFILGLIIFIWLFSFSWMYCAKDDAVALWWAKVAYLGLPFLPTAVYHFSMVFLQIYRQHRAMLLLCWILSALFSLIAVGTDFLISGVHKYPWGYYPVYGAMSVPYLLCFVGILSLSLYHHVREYQKAFSGTIHKLRIKAFIIAFSIAYLGVFDYSAKFHVSVYPFGYLPIFIFLIIVFFAISHYRFVDITPAFASSKIIDTMNDILLVLDPEGSIRLANKASQLFFNQFEDDLLGKHITQVINNTYFSEQLKSLLQSEPVQNYEFSCNSEKYGESILSLSITSIKDRKKHPLAYVFIAKDITSEKKSERALLKARADLNANSVIKQ